MNSTGLPLQGAPSTVAEPDVDTRWVDAAGWRRQLQRWLEPHGEVDATDPHLTAAWFALLAETAMPRGARFACWPLGARLALPMLQAAPGARRAEALATFYTPLYGAIGEVLSGSVDTAQLLECAARSRTSELRWWPMDPATPLFGALEAGLRRAGWWVDRYFCFGNWYHPVEPGGYAAYFAARPSQTRNTVARSARKLARLDGYRLDIHTAPGAALGAAVAAFVQVYNRSWKKPEPFPTFIPELCRVAAEQGWLRLGVVEVGGAPIAAQIWLVFRGKAHIVKLAYDQQFDQASAGSVLTAALMQRVIDTDGVTEVDYLIGDDVYKQSWMTERRERWGLIAFDPHTLHGLVEAARHFGGRALRRLWPQPRDGAAHG